jgi:hypothetical protein
MSPINVSERREPRVAIPAAPAFLFLRSDNPYDERDVFSMNKEISR